MPPQFLLQVQFSLKMKSFAVLTSARSCPKALCLHFCALNGITCAGIGTTYNYTFI